MARPKDPIPSVRVRLDGYLKRGRSPQEDALLNWLAELPRRQKFPLVMRRLMLGGVVEAVVEDGDVEAARVAAAQIMEAFVVE